MMTTTDKLKFRYVFEDGYELDRTYPFRPGDIVSVKDWGERYSTYRFAMEAFGIDEGNWRYDQRHGKPETFKIIGMLEHHQSKHQIICHLRSRDKRNYIVGIDGLSPRRVYQLRKPLGETEIVNVKKLR